jgi:prolyl-tRNA synthetase
MRLSRFFLPTLKETPSDAQIVSHRLMLRAGLIRQASAGIYSWLPLGYRVLRKIEQIVREEQDRAGAVEMLMPTIQSADRHDRDMLYGPTNEELITDIFRHTVRSYRDLPINLYHIQWKFRDEVRPRFGVMRGREFYMKDAYSFALDYAGARHAYNQMFVAYLKTFKRMGLHAIPLRADTGPIGGDLSHEFIILADTGESAVYCDKELLSFDISAHDIDYDGDLQPTVDHWTDPYAAADDMHVPDECPLPADRLVEARGIEVGHIFYFGAKYSKPMGAVVTAPDGSEVSVEMGSYGIGVSRLVGAVIEASHDEAGIVWPEPVAPFRVGLINIRAGDDACRDAADGLYRKLVAAGVEVLYDDSDESAGSKFAQMDLVGLPWQIVVGPRGVKAGTVELKNRATGDREELSAESALDELTG